MTIPAAVFRFLIIAALLLVALAPVVLLVLLVRDWRGGALW
jgi:hypothetical protein